MSKIIAILLIVFIFHLSPVFPTALASPSCNNKGITYTPTAFPPNPADWTLNFKIHSDNQFNFLKGKEVRLRFTQRFWQDYWSDIITVTTDSFPMKIGGQQVIGSYDPHSQGTHTGVLDFYTSNGKWEELCSGIVYTVGDPKTCVIDPNLPSRIPPDTEITIRFSGQPKMNYDLYTHPDNKLLKSILTGDDGQGDFKDVKLPGQNGNTIDLKIGDHNTKIRINTPLVPLVGITLRDSVAYCSKKITIDSNASLPGPPGTGPVPTAAPGTTTGPGGQPVKPPGPPTVSGGIPCGVSDSGVQTAIGCIHTAPAEFAKDILKFAIGISGGLAFLMMLVGAFQMLTSAGNPDSLNAGKERLTSAVIGLLFVIFAVLFLQIIGANILGLPDFKP